MKTHSGRTLPRTVVTFYGELKAVALALENIHQQLGCTANDVRTAEVFVDDLGAVGVDERGLYALQGGEVLDRWEFYSRETFLAGSSSSSELAGAPAPTQAIAAVAYRSIDASGLRSVWASRTLRVEILSRLGKHRREATPEQIAERLVAIPRDLGWNYEYSRVGVKEHSDGWTAAVMPKVRAQVPIWCFTPDGRLRRSPESLGHHGWDRFLFTGDQVRELLERWG